ncbi:hypothetical protein PSPO01_02898 [Paraphaeosphaeria sporulosa]
MVHHAQAALGCGGLAAAQRARELSQACTPCCIITDARVWNHLLELRWWGVKRCGALASLEPSARSLRGRRRALADPQQRPQDRQAHFLPESSTGRAACRALLFAPCPCRLHALYVAARLCFRSRPQALAHCPSVTPSLLRGRPTLRLCPPQRHIPPSLHLRQIICPASIIAPNGYLVLSARSVELLVLRDVGPLESACQCLSVPVSTTTARQRHPTPLHTPLPDTAPAQNSARPARSRASLHPDSQPAPACYGHRPRAPPITHKRPRQDMVVPST